MKKLDLQLLRFSLLLLTLSTLATLVFAQGFSPNTEARLQAVLEEFQNDPQNLFVGGVSAAIKVEGVAQWIGTTGYAARNINEQNELLPGGIPFLAETPSRIYSITKTFTAALVLELAAEGVLNLDDPVGNYLPISEINPQLSEAVTLRQLLAHESGFSDYANEQQFQIAIASQPDRFWQPLEILTFVNKIHEPGEVRRYSSTNYILLGAILETVTGKTVVELYRNRFFEPLNLSSMYLAEWEPQGERGTLAAPHDNISAFNPVFQATGRPTFPDYYTNISSLPFTGIVSAAYTGGGIVGNIYDLLAWGSALFTGRATRASTIEIMLNSIADTPEPDGDYLGYGLWTNNRISDTDNFIGHNGVAPGYRSVLFHQPDRKITIAILSNYVGADLYVVAKKLYEALPEIYCDIEEEKVQVCFSGEEICVEKAAVPALLSKGGYIGSCEISSINNLALVDADSDEELQEIKNGDVIDLAKLPSNKLSIMATTEPAAVGSVDFSLKGPFIHQHSENYAPYAIFGDNPAGDFSGRLLPPGEYTLVATPYKEKQKAGAQGLSLEVSFTIINSEEIEDAQVTGFDLYDAVTDKKILDLEGGTVIHKDELDHEELTVLIHTVPDFVGSVKVELEGPISLTRIENTKPYTLFRNNSKALFGRAFPTGEYHLKAIPYTETNAQGVAGMPLQISFTVYAAESSSVRIAVYPVPTTGVVHITHDDAVAGARMMLQDDKGNVLLSRIISDQPVEQLDLSSYKKGIYYLKIVSKDAVETKRLVVE